MLRIQRLMEQRILEIAQDGNLVGAQNLTQVYASLFEEEELTPVPAAAELTVLHSDDASEVASIDLGKGQGSGSAPTNGGRAA